MSVTFDFTGQVILVTGGASGLGFAISRAFGKAGATVALNDLSSERIEAAVRELSGDGITCRGFAADVRDAEAVHRMVDQVVDGLGIPSVTVANAGIYPNTPFLEVTEEEWNHVLDTNLKGTFLTCQTVARALVSKGQTGQLVTIASGAATTAFHGWSHYCTSKAAVVMLTRAMAMELGKHGIRVNSVLPGYIDVLEGGAHLDESYKRAARAANPSGRPGDPADIANAVLMLASPLASYMNGSAVTVDGGAGAGRMGVFPKTWGNEGVRETKP